MAKVTGLTAGKMLEIQQDALNALSVSQAAATAADSSRSQAQSFASSAAAARNEALTAANNASSAASLATTEANRAEAAAGSVNMDAINLRLNQMDTNIANKANLVGGKVPFVELATSVLPDPSTIPARVIDGRLPGIGDPIDLSDAVNKQYLDGLISLLDDDLTDFGSLFATKQDLMFSTRIETFGSTNIVNSQAAELVFLAAPVAMEITDVSLVFENAVNIGGTTNSCNIRIVHRPNTDADGINIVQQSSEVRRIGGSGDTNRRKVWPMKNGNWNTASNRIVPMGDAISLVVGSPKGSFQLPLPFALTMMWRPA